MVYYLFRVLFLLGDKRWSEPGNNSKPCEGPIHSLQHKGIGNLMIQPCPLVGCHTEINYTRVQENRLTERKHEKTCSGEFPCVIRDTIQLVTSIP